MGYLSECLPRKYFSLAETVEEIKKETGVELTVKDIIHFVKNDFPIFVYVLSDYITPSLLYLVTENLSEEDAKDRFIDIYFSEHSNVVFSYMTCLDEFHSIELTGTFKQFTITDDYFSFHGLLTVPSEKLKEINDEIIIDEDEMLGIRIDNECLLDVKYANLQCNERVTIQYSDLYITDSDLIILIKDILGRKAWDYGFEKIKKEASTKINESSEKLKNNQKEIRGKSETSYLNIIQALKDELLATGKYKNQNDLIDSLSNKYIGYQGLSESNLRAKFANANNIK
ncbi:hypothetical protein C8D76_105116 [Pasteurella langaaensis DSM 22999]|uniref:Uncharacterized protein n=1 Tax=Alitibacter langaaensis DSM 22999 TaxID=1122935 RepID=A0A2U0T840_9PAST|nr:hypothetical protein [Pasteurella langaaensis]PVX39775.1 hypothetical protein C8D76_105116 [Pasteurella langaaensis DSM 22999]